VIIDLPCGSFKTSSFSLTVDVYSVLKVKKKILVTELDRMIFCGYYNNIRTPYAGGVPNKRSVLWKK
jgi:hypothetical protein